MGADGPGAGPQWFSRADFAGTTNSRAISGLVILELNTNPA